MFSKSLGLLLCISLPLSACDDSGSAAQSRWNITSAVDPLTDAEVTKATATYNATPFKAEVSISCGGPTILEYEFATFGEDQGANNRGESANFQSSQFEGASIVTFEMRLGSDPARTYAVINPRYSNTVSILPRTRSNDWGDGILAFATALIAAGSGAQIPDAVAAARAKRLVLKLPLQGGEALLDIDQTEPEIRNFLDECLAAFPAETKGKRPTESAGEFAESSDPETNVEEAIDSAYDRAFNICIRGHTYPDDINECKERAMAVARRDRGGGIHEEQAVDDFMVETTLEMENIFEGCMKTTEDVGTCSDRADLYEQQMRQQWDMEEQLASRPR